MNVSNIKIPKHVGIILDGNGRWAKEKGKKRNEGHKEGYNNLKKISKYILNKGTKVLSVFAFSTENFKRPQEEVDYLMNLFIQGFKSDSGYFKKENIKVIFSGSRDNLRADVIDAMDKIVEMTNNNTLGILNICLNYGSHDEILGAVNHIIEDGVTKGVVLADGTVVNAKYVALLVGRTGSSWLSQTLKKHNVSFTHNRVDIGVRVETNDIIMNEINEKLYEGKFLYRTSVGTIARTFCSNPSGHVVIENHHGIMLCNGHAYNSTTLGSSNTNFALLVSQEFDEPFNEPTKYAEEIAKLANKLSNGSVIVQRYGDIKRGRRSTQKRIEEGFVKPTLKEAVPGDLGLVLPYNVMKSLVETIEALDHVTPGIANEHTLFYGVEAKFYSERPEVDSNFETKIKNLYVGGDGAGITRGLAQAGANGVKIARVIIDKTTK